MDYRLMDDIERYMSGRGLRDKYDHIVLAGASLGAITDKYPKLASTNNRHHLGTLDTGNHFIEVCLDEANRVWVKRKPAYTREPGENGQSAHTTRLRP